jgi:hypothetical protein
MLNPGSQREWVVRKSPKGKWWFTVRWQRLYSPKSYYGARGGMLDAQYCYDSKGYDRYVDCRKDAIKFNEMRKRFQKKGEKP